MESCDKYLKITYYIVYPQMLDVRLWVLFLQYAGRKRVKKIISELLTGMLCTGMLLAGCGAQNAEETAGKAVNENQKATESKKEELTKVTLNEVAHSIFYAPQYVAIEVGYFVEEGIRLELVTGFGADKVMAAVLSGDADIGFMGSESSIYAYQQGANDPVVNFAQLTQRAGNFVVAREEMPDFTWSDLKGRDVLGGRKGVVHKSM